MFKAERVEAEESQQKHHSSCVVLGPLINTSSRDKKEDGMMQIYCYVSNLVNDTHFQLHATMSKHKNAALNGKPAIQREK